MEKEISTLKKALSKISRRIADVVYPELRYSQNIYESSLVELVDKDSIWLDLGCGHEILPEWRIDSEKDLAGKCQRIVGIDYDMLSLKKHGTITDLVRGDICCLPFRDNSFSLITSNMVLEHVEHPLPLFEEINRILIPGGKFIFHTPNKYGYNTIAARLLPEFTKPFLVKLLHGRHEEDRFSTFYRCNTDSLIRNLARDSGLRIDKLKHILSTPQFAIFPPLFLLELLYLRIISLSLFRKFRINIIAVIDKQR